MDRPRRTVKPTPKLTQQSPQRVPHKRKFTPEPIDPKKQLKTLLESSKSDLVSLDLQDIINRNTWDVLSDDARRALKALLPPTAFRDALCTIGPDHPSVVSEDIMVVDSDETKNTTQEKDVNLAFFSDPHLLAAQRTFQDHLYLNWLSDAHKIKVERFEKGVANGALAAPWKDQIWEQENEIPVVQPASSFSMPGEGSARVGAAAEIKLSVIAKTGIVRVGDVIAYRRCFTTADVTVEKDCIIEDIHPKTHALTVLALPGSIQHLPSHLLSYPPTSTPPPPVPSSSSSHNTSHDTSSSHPNPITTQNPLAIQSMTITSPSSLETALLDLDGRVERARRPNGNAWKKFTVWRWRGGAGGMGVGGEHNEYDARGGRENHGTLFYLRGSCCHER